MTKSLTNLTPSGVERIRAEAFEEAAKIIYEAMRWAVAHKEAGDPPAWVERGNSLAQSEARSAARQISEALALPSEPPSQGDGWCFDMKSAPANCLIFDPKWGVYEGLRFDGGNWGIATFNGSIIGASPVAWRPKPEAPALNQGADDGR